MYFFFSFFFFCCGKINKLFIVLSTYLELGKPCFFFTITDAQRGKKTLMPYANSESRDEHANQCRLLWTFSVCRHILQYPLILKGDNEGPDQPAQTRRLIWACVVRTLHKGPFRMLHII